MKNKETDMEMDMLNNENEQLRKENEELRRENDYLISEIKNCHSEIEREIAVVTAIKKDLRRYEVQLNSLKTENAEFKNKFAKIENNPVGKFGLTVYRHLREMKRRRG